MSRVSNQDGYSNLYASSLA